MAQWRAVASVVHKEGTLKKSLVALLAIGFCLVASQNAMAEANLGLRAVGVQVGVVNAEELDATFGVGGVANWGTLTPNFQLTSHLDYWSKSEGSPGLGEVSFRDIALGVRGQYLIPVSSEKVQPYVGVGVGMHFLNAKVEVPGFPTVDDGTTKVGLDFGGGITAPVNPRMDFMAETWYGVVDGFNQFSLKGGLSFKVGQ